MPDILSLLQCLLPQIKATTMRQLNQIILAMLAMNGSVTTRGISRWAGIGGSYRAILRFFHTVIPWKTRYAKGDLVLAILPSAFVSFVALAAR